MAATVHEDAGDTVVEVAVQVINVGRRRVQSCMRAVVP